MYRKIILKEYKPALTKGVKKLELDLSHKVNVIIGHNGVGKTSLLREVNVFPAENKNFGPGMYKYIERTYQGNLYTMISDKGKHSFTINNGENLNPNGTVTVQKELVQKHFNITPKMLSLLNGLEQTSRFSMLSTSQRKDLLMSLYPHDTTYAMGVFKRLTTAHRDNEGALRNLTKRLAEERDRYQKLQDLNNEDLLKRIATIDNTLKEALLFQGSLSGISFNEDELRVTYRDFNKLVSELSLFDHTKYTRSRSVLTSLINEADGVIAHKKKLIEKRTDRINEITKSLNGTTLIQQDPVVISDQIKMTNEELKGLNKELEILTSSLAKYPVFCDTDLSHLVPHTDNFIAYLRAVIPRNPENGVTGGQYRIISNRLAEDNNSLRSVINQINDYEHTLKHYNGLEEVQCPDCTVRFKPGVKKEQIESINLRLNKLKIDKVELEQRIKADERIVEDNADWYSSMLTLTNYIKENRTVTHLLFLVQEYKVGDDENGCNNLINALQTNYKTHTLKERIKTTNEELGVLNARLELFKSNDMVALITEFNQCEQELGECNASLFDLNAYKSELVKESEEIAGYYLKIGILKELRVKLANLLTDKGKVQMRDEVELLIGQLSPEKDQLVADLIRSKSSFNVITSIEENIATLQKRNLALKKLIDSLCPNKGLIGKMMSDFIATICANVNSIVREVWVSPLWMKPCSKENGELNYLFPVINSYDNSANGDVGACSGGEREILDWAMNVTINSYSNADLPIFMDEIGVAMDEVHRPRFFEYVKNFSRSDKANQLFMISHYVNQYGLLDGANIIRLEAAK